MPYPQRLLNRHEEVAVDLHPHWWYYSKPVIALVIAIIVGIVTLTSSDAGTAPRTGLTGVSLILLGGSTAWLVIRYLKWATAHFVITSDRLIFRSGILAKRGVEIPLERINTVHFNQSIFERVIGAGDLIIESGGGDGHQRFTDIRRPERVQRMIHTQMEENERRRSAVGGTGSRGDIATQLEKLEGMLRRGTLSADEFRAQKERLLGS